MFLKDLIPVSHQRVTLQLALCWAQYQQHQDGIEEEAYQKEKKAAS